MKLSLFQGILIGVFGLGAVIGVFVFATYSGGSSKAGIGPVVIWGTLPQTSMNAALSLVEKTNTDLKRSPMYKGPLDHRL